MAKVGPLRPEIHQGATLGCRVWLSGWLTTRFKGRSVTLKGVGCVISKVCHKIRYKIYFQKPTDLGSTLVLPSNSSVTFCVAVYVGIRGFGKCLWESEESG